MKLLKNKESGQTLIVALILLALGSLLVVPLLRHTFTNLGYHQSIECKTLNSYSADSGLEYALFKLYDNPGGYVDTPLQVAFTLNSRTVNVTANYTGGGVYKVTSTASGGGCGRTRIIAYVNLSAGAFAYAVAAKNDMTLVNTTVDSLPDPGEGDIHANGNIILTGTTSVNGDASAVGTISGQEKVTGMVTEGSPPVEFPGDYSQLYKTMAQEGGTHTGTLTITEDQDLGPLYIEGGLRVENATVTLKGTVYVTGKISVENGTLDGDENVAAEGDINIEQGVVRATRIPVVTSFKVGGRIYSEQGSTIDAVLYAPYGSVELENGIVLYGAVGAQDVLIDSSTINWAKQLQGREDVPGGELHTISYSYE
jgi:cytoskeletal protein CcmA (bactofilin family)